MGVARLRRSATSKVNKGLGRLGRLDGPGKYGVRGRDLPVVTGQWCNNAPSLVSTAKTRQEPAAEPRGS